MKQNVHKAMKIYVAGKLNADAILYIMNLHRMIKTAESVRKLGCAVFVPGLDFLMGMMFGDWNYEDYFNNSQPWLAVADAVFVGADWQTSVGTKREIETAESLGIPIFYNLKLLEQWLEVQSHNM